MIDYLKSEHQKRVEKMMTMACQELHNTPTLPSPETRRLRALLILEETLETIQALGFEIYLRKTSNAGALELDHVSLKATPFTQDDSISVLENIVDGCADIIVVATGCLSAVGMPDIPILEAIDMNNLEKFGPGGYKRKDGKWIKPLGHKSPNIRKILESFMEKKKET